MRLGTRDPRPAAVGSPDLARYMTFGASPRASINMVLGAKALAFLRGRDYALPARRARPGPRRAAPPPRPVLRGAGRRHRARRPARPDAGRRPAARRHPRDRRPDQRERAERRLGDPRADRDAIRALTPERVLRRLEWRVSAGSTGGCRATTGRCSAAPASTSPTCASTSPATTCATSTGTSPRALDTPYVREYIEDREVTAWLLLDRSRVDGLRARWSGSKHVVLTEVAATLAQLLSRGGNRVGALLFDTGVERDDPARAGPQPGAADPRPARRLRAAAARAAPRHHRPRPALLRAALGDPRRRSLVVIVSDFISRAGLGAAAGAARAPPRRGRHPGGRPARVRAARPPG